jgi:hypothetical protein
MRALPPSRVVRKNAPAAGLTKKAQGMGDFLKMVIFSKMPFYKKCHNQLT